MGVYLSTPNTEVSAEEGVGYGLRYCVGEIQGWRKNMEDAHIACTEVADVDPSRDGDMVSLFGVFDGHGGKEVAKFCQLYFQQELVKMPEFFDRDFPTALRKTFHKMDEMLEDEQYDYQLQQFRKLPNPSDKRAESDEEAASTASSSVTGGRKISTSEAVVLFQTLLDEEKKKRAEQVSKAPLAPLPSNYQPTYPVALNTSNASDEGDKYPNDANMTCRLNEHSLSAGCTAVVALKHGDQFFVANAGDSRAVLCRGENDAYALSFDHKPADKIESDRIVKANGFVNHVGRVNGNLNLSRAIGDLKYKQSHHLSPAEQIISGDPDITITQLLSTDKFVVIACDGIWDCFSNQEVVDFVQERRAEGKDLRVILDDIFDFCVSVDPRTTQGIGGDNMTCMIVDLQAGTSSSA